LKHQVPLRYLEINLEILRSSGRINSRHADVFLVFNEFMDEWHRINTVNIDVEKKQWGSPLAKLSTTGFCFHIELLVLEEAKSYVVITVMG
jgi:hypothetical protein